jgi:hypothetical protein
MSDYYIRERDSEEARGPYTVGKLATLVESGQISRETLYFDEEKSAWLSIGDSTGLAQSLFPERRKLTLRTATSSDSADTKVVKETHSAEVVETEKPGPQIDEMLAAADGRTEDTRHLKRRQRSAEAAARYLCPMLGLAFVMSAFSLLYPNLDALQKILAEQQWSELKGVPFVWVGMVDLFIALCCFLAVAEIFRFIRFRAALGLGFGAYVGWAAGDMQYLLAMVVAMAGVWIATCTQRLSLMFIAFICMLGGLGTLVMLALMGRFEILYGPFGN